MSDAASQKRSRYKDTPVFTDAAAGDYLGILEVPAELSEIAAADYGSYAVTPPDVGFPDAIAVSVYGDGYEDLWWVVMLANGIADPETELWPGRVLRVPPRTAVQAFLSRTAA